MGATKFCYECSALIVREATRCRVCGAGQPGLEGVDRGLLGPHEVRTIEATRIEPVVAERITPTPLPAPIQAPRFAEGRKDRPTFVGPIGAPEDRAAAIAAPRASRITAGLLALLLGGLGAHHFYIGRWGFGILYLLFSWTFIPALVGLIEACVIFGMNDEAFRRGYGLAA